MDSIERKKANPYNINEKEILDIVAAKGSCLSHISGDLKEVAPHKESSSRPESKKTITDEEVKNILKPAWTVFHPTDASPCILTPRCTNVSHTLSGQSDVRTSLFPVL